MYQIIDGARLRSQETTSALAELRSLEIYQNLLDKITEVTGLSLESMKVQQSYQYNTLSDKDNVGNFYGKTLTLTDENEEVVIGYSDISYENEESNNTVFLSGSIVTEEDGKKIQKIFTIENDAVDIITKEREAEFELKDTYQEDLPDSPDFRAAVYSPKDVSANAWYDGCAPGGYQHCGAGCGYNLSRGGGAPINSTDRCCIGHDQCWAGHGNNDPCCDKNFLNCLTGIYTVVATAAKAIFSFNARNC